MCTASPRVQGDQVFAGNVRFLKAPTLPAGSIDDADVEDGAGIAAENLEHQHRATFSQPNATSAAALTQQFFTCFGASARVVGVKVGVMVAAIGDSTATFAVQKADGTSVLA